MRKTVEICTDVYLDEIFYSLSNSEKKEVLTELFKNKDITIEDIKELIEKNFHKDDIEEIVNSLTQKVFKKSNLKFNEDLFKLTKNYYQLTEEEIYFIEKVSKRFI